jgi:hypothetical protein
MLELHQDHRAWIISWTFQWLDAVDRQAGRALDLPDHGKGQVEILLFVGALRNVLRGAEAILGKQHPAVRCFYEAVPGARDIRDMLEHFDEYVTGSGRLQKSESSDWLVYFSSDREEGGERTIHVGGRELDVETAALAARTLAVTALNQPSITQVSNDQKGGEK